MSGAIHWLVISIVICYYQGCASICAGQPVALRIQAVRNLVVIPPHLQSVRGPTRWHDEQWRRNCALTGGNNL